MRLECYKHAAIFICKMLKAIYGEVELQQPSQSLHHEI